MCSAPNEPDASVLIEMILIRAFAGERGARFRQTCHECWTSAQVEGIESSTGLAWRRSLVEWRIAEIQSEIHRLRRDVEGIKNALWAQEHRQQEASLNRAYFALSVVIMAVLLGALSAGFGWI